MLKIIPPAKLLVLAEYESSGIWLNESGEISMMEHENLGLPQELSDRFYEWINLYFNRLKPSVAAAWDLDRFNAMGRSIAKDLKDFVGPAIMVEFIPELSGDRDGKPEVIY